MDISCQSLSVGIFTVGCSIFSKNRAILVQILRKEKKLSKSVSGYFMTKKKEETTAIAGGRKTLMARP